MSPNHITILLLSTLVFTKGLAQSDDKVFHDLIASYAEAREKQDAELLANILTDDIDQLVSSGEWRLGLDTAVQGMKRSSQVNEGNRVLTVDKVKQLSPEVAIVDARYQIISPGGETRNMWSTFIVVMEEENWKISAIRNMLPTSP
ncbi:YybH family protein [Pleomorphovibrio marinus]|uniref:YybH family protein n=1 Tax=Pleomorphovibrio marinus TaxID=2164132 RepID=UPI000E0B18C2|nr:SgcJ/EcaC family oxidoreductase [Pleomorphovibrio marinus]